MNKKWFNAEEVAEALDKSPRTVRNHIRKGELPAAKVGRSYVITRDDLARYLNGMERVEAIFGASEE